MTPDQIAFIQSDAQQVLNDEAGFATAFYDHVFEFAPEARALFADDLTEQRGKLVREVEFLVRAATAFGDAGAMESFVGRARALGARHVGYGVRPDHYAPVAAAMVATMWVIVDGFNADHENAWERLLGLIAETMLEGAAVSSLESS